MTHIDKNSIKHFAINYTLAAAGGLYGASAAAGASVTKEWFDKESYGHWCWWDIIFDILGIAAGLGTRYLIFKTL